MTSLAVAAELPAPERVRFDSLDRVEGASVRVEGLLFVPEAPAPAGGRPAVIALHGCGGMYSSAKGRADQLSQRHADKARTWLAAGYAVLFPDSLGPRGLREVCTVKSSERTVRPAQRRGDALGALAWLGRQAGIDPSRVALVGWSHGGSTALATIDATDERVAAWRKSGQVPFFRAAVAFYPGCSASLRNARWKPAAPLTILIGADDDWTPVAPCEALASRMQGTTPAVDLVVYPGAYHGFDAPTGSVRLRSDVPNGVSPGAGVHVGPHPAARERANAKLAQVLKEALAR